MYICYNCVILSIFNSGGSGDQEPKRTAVCYIVADSRANNFDNSSLFKQPEELTIKYCIVRGAKIVDLSNKFLRIIDGENFEDKFPVVIKIACGINDLTQFKRNKEGENELHYSGKEATEVIQELVKFKTDIKQIIPNALVGFVTIPPLSFKLYHEHCKQKQGLKHPELTDEILETYQTRLDSELDKINNLIKVENCLKQSGHSKGCMTVSWHNTVCRQSKRKRNSGRYKVVTKNNFKELYDGLHANSDLKHKWFNQIIDEIRAEIRYTVSDREEVTVDEHHTTDSSDSECEGSWNFKRRVIFR